MGYRLRALRWGMVMDVILSPDETCPWMCMSVYLDVHAHLCLVSLTSGKTFYYNLTTAHKGELRGEQWSAAAWRKESVLGHLWQGVNLANTAPHPSQRVHPGWTPHAVNSHPTGSCQVLVSSKQETVVSKICMVWKAEKKAAAGELGDPT